MHHFAAGLQSAATAVCIEPDRCETLRILQNRCKPLHNCIHFDRFQSIQHLFRGDAKHVAAQCITLQHHCNPLRQQSALIQIAAKRLESSKIDAMSLQIPAKSQRCAALCSIPVAI
jgi:hypothetical protein